MMDQATRVMSSSSARSRWFSCTRRTSLMTCCWKPISWNWARSWRNSSAYNRTTNKVTIYTNTQRFVVVKILSSVLLFSKDALNWWKVTNIYNDTKSYISNKCCSFQMSIYQRILTTKIFSSTTVLTLIIIRNVYWAAVYQNDFWGSCDTEDWSNDAENTALIAGINYILN